MKHEKVKCSDKHKKGDIWVSSRCDFIIAISGIHISICLEDGEIDTSNEFNEKRIIGENNRCFRKAPK